MDDPGYAGSVESGGEKIPHRSGRLREPAVAE